MGSPPGTQRTHGSPLSASVQEVLIVPLLPMALVAPDEVEKNESPLYRYRSEAGGGGGGLPGKRLYRECFCQHSCHGEVLASRKDFRMNTCTPHPRGAFMLEPVGMSPMETLLLRNQKGEGLEVGGLVGRKGLPGWASCPVPCAASSGPMSSSLLRHQLRTGLLEFVPLPCLSAAGSVPGCPSPVPGLCSPSPALVLLDPWEGPSRGAGLTLSNSSSIPEAERAEEQPMEVSVCSSPVPAPSISQEPGACVCVGGLGG